MTIDHFSYNAPPTVRVEKKCSPEEAAVTTCIDWMLTNIRSQFDGLKTYSLLTPISSEHRVTMIVVQRTLQQLREAIVEKNMRRAYALFEHITQITSVSDQSPNDPRFDVNQILNLYKDFESLRSMRSDEDR